MVRNCGLRIKVDCPKIWDSLTPTADSAVRHCAQCKENVYFCATDAETIAHARAGHCIARDRPAGPELPPGFIGRLEAPRILTAEQRAAQQRLRKVRGIDTLINGRFEGTTRECPECSYPVPDFRKSCYVCGHEVGRAP